MQCVDVCFQAIPHKMNPFPLCCSPVPGSDAHMNFHSAAALAAKLDLGLYIVSNPSM